MAVETKSQHAEKDLGVLYPERQAEIAGRLIVMHELTFEQSLRMGRSIKALVDAMAQIGLDRQLHDIDSLRGAFADQYDDLVALIAICCGEEAQWVRTLDATSGEQLQLLWWAVNSSFFLQRVLTTVQLELLRKVGARDGLTSSPCSSRPATTRSGSVATPTDN